MPTTTIMPGDANYLSDVQVQYDWQLALTRAIAEYWRNPNGEFARVLFGSDPGAITNQFFNVLNYQLPKGITLKFEPVDISFEIDSNVNGWAAHLNELTANVVVKIPKAPPNEKYWPRAIVDYVATGKAYPFT